jgi:hypothetical protein
LFTPINRLHAQIHQRGIIVRADHAELDSNVSNGRHSSTLNVLGTSMRRPLVSAIRIGVDGATAPR